MPRSSRSDATVSRCWRARRSVGASSAAWRPASAAAARAHAATAVLPEPTSPWTRRSIGTGRARSSRISSRAAAWSPVSSTAWPSLREMDAAQRPADPAVGRGIHGDRRRVGAASRTTPADHAQLEREELVEGEPAQRRVPRLEGLGVVRRLERLRDRRQRLARADVRGQVLRIGVARGVERRAHGRPQAVRGQAGGEPVDRHDPARRGAGSTRRPAGSPGPRTRREPRKCLIFPETSSSSPGRTRLSTNRRPNQVAVAVPVPSTRCAVVTWTRRRHVCCTRDVEDGDARRGDRPVVQVAQLREASAARAGRRSGAAGGTAGPARSRCPCAGRGGGVTRPRRCRTGRPARRGSPRGPSAAAWRRRGGARGSRVPGRSACARSLGRDQVPVVGLPAVGEVHALETGRRLGDLARRATRPRRASRPRRSRW